MADLPRTESERKVRNAFRTESGRSPSDSGQRNPGRVGSGVGNRRTTHPGRGRDLRDYAAESEARWQRMADFGAKHFPQQSVNGVIAAITVLRRTSDPVNPQTVEAWMRQNGWWREAKA